MKKAVILCMLLIGFGATAQQRAHHRHGNQQMHRDLTPEQQASLQSRKMTLDLDLDPTQQEKVESLLSRHFKQRQEQLITREGKADTLRREPGAHYRRLSQRLDHQIAFQRKLKEILSPSQFEQWQQRRLAGKSRHRYHRGRN